MGEMISQAISQRHELQLVAETFNNSQACVSTCAVQQGCGKDIVHRAMLNFYRTLVLHIYAARNCCRSALLAPDRQEGACADRLRACIEQGPDAYRNWIILIERRAQSV
jgi:hypothetical protein